MCAAARQLIGWQPSLTIHLFPGGFSIEGMSDAHTFTRPYRKFVEAIEQGLLPLDSMIDLPSAATLQFYDGAGWPQRCCDGRQGVFLSRSGITGCHRRRIRTPSCTGSFSLPIMLPSSPTWLMYCANACVARC